MLTILCCVLSVSSSPRPRTVWRHMVLGFAFSRPALRFFWVPPSIVLRLILPSRRHVPLPISSEYHGHIHGDTLFVLAPKRAGEIGVCTPARSEPSPW